MNISEIINIVLSTPNAAFFYTPPIYGKSKSYLFLKPKEIVSIKSLNKLDERLRRIDELVKKGFIGYSLMNYEAGYLFEKTLNKYLPKNEKLLQFFFYDKKNVQRLKSFDIDFGGPENCKIKNFKLNTSKSEFTKSIQKIKSYIEEGDTYQVNYTIKGKFNFKGSCSGLFTNLIFNQSAKYTVVINNGSDIIFSLSPELFFEIEGKKIISKPMKGTARREINIISDSLVRHQLETSGKNRAENVMIVDLIRNDLGRISEYGSVKVNTLFEIEKYESIYQMVSTIESKLRKNTNLSEVLKNIFPCGSITGAPKIRTMEIINELEKEKREIYTGSIGLIRKNKITFNVPIRTICLNKKSGNGKIGLGSGIVWDSDIDDEFYETKLKGKFLTEPVKPFEIIETMSVENKKVFLLDEHLNRMQKAAEFFLFLFERNKISEQLKTIIESLDNKKYKLRITLNKWGTLNHFISPIFSSSKEIKVIISNKLTDSQNKFQYFKTTNRKLYDKEFKKYSAKGFFDVIFFNENGELAEGSTTNIFLIKGKEILTPPIEAGILDGVYRKNFIEKRASIIEKNLFIDDLLKSDKIVLTNSVRREIVVNLLYINEREIIRVID